jgi:hemoglobin
MSITDVSELFEAAGRDESPFADLVEAFYRRVESDPPLRALYPDELAPGKQHLTWFLIERFGGPARFAERRGAPMLRRRHAAFAITRDQAQRWLVHMSAAVDEVPIFAENKEVVIRYFEDAAVFLINRGHGDPSGAPDAGGARIDLPSAGIISPKPLL